MINLLRLLNLDKLLANLIGYVETKVELYKLDALDGLTKLMGKLFFLMIAMFMCGMALVFAEFSLAFYIQSVTGSFIIGFLSVFGLNLLLLIIVILLAKAGFFSKMVAAMVLKMFLKQKSDKRD